MRGDSRVAAFNKNLHDLTVRFPNLRVREWNPHVHTFSAQDELWAPKEITHMTKSGYRIRNNYYADSLSRRDS